MKKRNEIFSKIAAYIESAQIKCPFKVAIDGIDASGKTIFADDFAQYLKTKTNKQVIRASIDGFHNPEEIRLRKAKQV